MAATKEKLEVTISNRTVLRVLAMLIFAYLGVRAFVSLAQPITLILIAFFLALALNPAVSWVSRRLRSKNRSLATAIAFITVLVLLVSFFSVVIPPLARQVGDFVKDVPSTVQNLKTQDSPVGRGVRRYGLDNKLDEFAHDFSQKIGPKPILDTAGRVGEVLVSTLAVLAMTFMMLNEGPSWMERLMALVPANKRAHRRKLLAQMYGMVTGYVNGQLIMATIAASFLLVMLLITSSLLNVSVNALALAGIMAIFGLIPMIGNPIGAVIVVTACVLSSFNLAIIVGIYFLIYFQIENITLQPYIQSKQNELTPLTVFVSALIGISYAGIIGALFAIPVAGCLRIVLIDWATSRGYLQSTEQPG